MKNPARNEAVRILNSYINTVVPKLQAIFSEGVKCKVSGEPHKKYAEKINAVLVGAPKRVRAYVTYDGSSPALKADITHKDLPDHNGYQSTSYITEYAYLWDLKEDKAIKFDVLPAYTDEEVEQKQKDLEDLIALRSKINSQINSLKVELNL